VAHPLDGPLQKLQRADEHIDALDRELKTWERSHPNPIGVTFQGHTDQTGNVFRFDFREPPTHTGLIFGDAVTNMRSALDHVTWQLALSNCGESTTPYKRTAFPIQNDPESWESTALDVLRHVRPEAWDLIESLQPYHGFDWPDLGWLRYINELANADKHRATPFVAGRATITDRASKSSVKIPHTLKNGDMLQLHIEPANHDRHLDIAAQIGVECEGEMVGVAGLSQLNRFVRDEVIPLFGGFFDERSPTDNRFPTRPPKKRNTRSNRKPKKR